jgi:hypothetical protein
MACTSTLTKYPEAVLPVSIDWTDLETSLVESLGLSVWKVPPGIRVNKEWFVDGIATIVVSGGKSGDSYVLRNTVTGIKYADAREITIQVL